ncbi:MAG: laminin sub domain 2, partial [Solirubrobacterales bacterium]|nr:laminin sub domain 2 [Solirubrobacterales bacterium]
MRRLLTRIGRRVAPAAMLIVAVVGTGAAQAYLSGTATGAGGGRVGTLNAPSAASASTVVGSSTVTVSWTASAPAGGLTPSGYYVRRWSAGTPTLAGGTCGTPSSPVNKTSCKDEGVSDGTYTYTVVAVYRSWTAESAHSSSATVQSDVTAPVTTIETSPTAPEGTNGWFEKSSVSFTLHASDAGSGVETTRYTLDGGSQQTYGGSVAIVAQGDHAVTYWSIDKAGNEESPHHTTHIKLDSVAPSNALAIGSPNHALLSGSTLYFNGGSTGSFTLTNTVTDATSGPASATFPLVTAANWTHAAQTVSTPSGGPYASSTYSWTSAAGTPSGAQATFSSTDSAANTGASTLTFVSDTAPPSAGALSVNGTAASAAGSTSASTSTAFAIGSRADYTEAQSSSQSGLASSTLTIQSETLTGNTCGAAGSGGPYTSATTVTGTSNP